VLAGLTLSAGAMAGPSTFIEGALIDGGENARNGNGDQAGLEIIGSYAINDSWYVGGGIGRFTNDAPNGDTDNDYININTGATFGSTEKTDFFGEVGLWLGEQDNPGTGDTDPTAIELKTGVNHMVTDKIGVFGTLAWVAGDLDTGGNEDLRNYVWSLGGSYAFNELFSLNLKMVNGVNGVNGQDEVLRLGARWTF